MAISQSELGRRWKFTQQYIGKLVARGMPLHSEKAAALWFAEHVQHRDAGAGAEEIVNAARQREKSPATLSSIMFEAYDAIQVTRLRLEEAKKSLLVRRVRTVERSWRKLATDCGIDLDREMFGL